ncbi:MAG: acyltransferase, partial [Bryobacteraceae bacterium]|nr:acyltransferase [Bryobacteraceae bacterium]
MSRKRARTIRISSVYTPSNSQVTKPGVWYTGMVVAHGAQSLSCSHFAGKEIFVSFLDDFILRIKRGDTPFYRLLRTTFKKIIYFSLPPLPGLLKPSLRFLYELHYFLINLTRWIITRFYSQPLFQSRCHSVGKNLVVWGLPFVNGHVEIHIGNNVTVGFGLDILSGRFLDKPQLIIKDRVSIGDNLVVSVNQQVVIEEDVLIASNCRISDNDGHPKRADLRAQNAPLDPRDIRPVRICRNAWIGNNAHILKGVTIGEGAIIGANSVVISDIPPYSLAFGNPAEVYFRDVGRPKAAAA